MTNLEQIRANGAIGPAGDLDKKAVNALPALILGNGLLATTAFCMSESEGESRSGMRRALEITIGHLRLMKHVDPDTDSLEKLVRDLARRNSLQLQEATAEALAFIGYLRRFAKKHE
jgi:CRISPR-associated protein Cmr5